MHRFRHPLLLLAASLLFLIWGVSFPSNPAAHPQIALTTNAILGTACFLSLLWIIATLSTFIARPRSRKARPTRSQ
ncbi:MAG: hypothetical protein ACTHN5_10000 [Phycisphaerae bacterium]